MTSRIAMLRGLTHGPLARGTSRVLIAGQIVLSVPLSARATSAPTPIPPVPLVTLEQTAPLPEPKVTVNRTVPLVTPPPSEPQFSAQPTVQEIFRARVFGEPLVPVGGEPSSEETRALAAAVLQFHRAGGVEWRPTLGRFLLNFRESPWRASLLANIAVLQHRAHADSGALAMWDEAWGLAQHATDAHGRAVADFALGEWLELSATFGHVAAVRDRLAAVADRPIGGPAGVKVAQAREKLALIVRERYKIVPCGAEALLALLAARRPEAAPPAVLNTYRAPADGTSLMDLRELAAQVGMPLHMAARTNAVDLPVPAVVHLKVGHYVAVVQRTGDYYRISDGAQGMTYWMHRDTLLDETSGYVLVPAVPRDGWRTVEEGEALTVRGFGSECPDDSPPPEPPCTKCCPTGGGGSPGGGGGCSGGQCANGMAAYAFQDVTASLLLFDTPVGYTPARGPGVPLSLSYHHRDRTQPQIFTTSNVGPKWAFGWMRFIQEEPLAVDAPARVWVYQPPGGREVYSVPDANGVYPAHWASRAVLVKVSTSPLRYERRRTDGVVEVYGLADGAPVGQRRVFLSELIDPFGHRLTFTWDAQLRLRAITDALGQVTTLDYDHPTDALKLTRITDPYGRAAALTYNAAGQLASITDVIGLTSELAYGRNDFVNSLTTPYGITTFRHEPNTLNDLNFRFIEATDPLGGTERVEFQYQTPALAATVPAGEVPTGFSEWNSTLDRANTFYWDKWAYLLGKGDLSKATVTHWLGYQEWSGGRVWASPVPHSMKKPLEARVWYAYPGQTTFPNRVGSWRDASRIGRVLDDGSSQIQEATYNEQGSVLTRTDPLGRQTSYTYAADGVTLMQVRQTTAGINDVLATYGNFTAVNQPQSITDAAGQVTTLTYNAAGQVLTVTNAKNETTTYAYDASSGKLSSVAGPVAGATTTYTYDGYGRARTITDRDNYTVTLDYDLFDRPTRTTYPDGTYEETTYHRLDGSTRRDRAGRITRYYHDALRRLTATRDPAGRVVTQEWCACGSLEALIDANGNRTRWERDVQGRVTREVRADGVTATVYTYEPLSGRLGTMTDPKQQVTTHQYHRDDALASTTYTNAVIATPGVSYTYDMQYGRQATMTDGIGLTTYTYHPAGQIGAGQVASVDGPLTNDTITYSYDQLGRLTTRAINGVGVTWAFDALGRVTSEANVLGTFAYTYDGASGRVATVTYPNSQTSAYSYFGNSGDRRLQTIHHKYPNGNTLSKFDYTYDSAGNILSWRQQADTAAVLWEYRYDNADQLVAAIKKGTDAQQTVLKRYAYAYDPAGNRTAEQIDDQVTGAFYDNLNRLLSHQSSGAVVFSGTVSEPATVKVQATVAEVSPDNQFRASVSVASGTNLVSIAATDPSGNTATREYEVDSLGSARTFTYDANGNLTSDDNRTFEWDAKNQLIGLNSGTTRTEFDYDGNGRRVRLRVFTNGQLSHYTALVMCDFRVCEERVLSAGVQRAVHTLGQLDGGTPVFLFADHLGSVRDTTSQAGVRISGLDFDPFGRVEESGGPPIATASFAQLNNFNGIQFGVYREYDPGTGRWLKQDPIGTDGGLNLYGYADNNPLVGVDPLGLTCSELGRFPVGLWKLIINITTYGEKQLTFFSVQLPWKQDKRGGSPWTVVRCQWTRKAFEEKVWERPVVVMELCDTDCGAVIQFRQTYERSRSTREYDDRGWFGFTLPFWVSPVLAEAECKRKLN